jgi:hypothetical protein
MQSIAEIVRDLLIFIVAMSVLFVALIVVVFRLPDDNPLKRILSALTYRVGVTLGAGVVALPIEPIPGLDTLYDIAVPIGLLYYWVTFFLQVYRATRPRRPGQPRIGEL